MYSINYSDNSIEITNSYIERVFKDRSLQSLTIEGKKNCCEDLEKITYDLSYPLDTCVYEAVYKNFENQQTCGAVNTKFNDNCENPLGSYYRNFNELLLFVNGSTKNIITKTYDLNVASNITELELFVNNYLSNLGFTNSSFVVTTTTLNGFLEIKTNFYNLPPNVIPQSNIIANEETCFVNVTYDCDKGEICTEKTFEGLINSSIKEFNFGNLSYEPLVAITKQNYLTEIETLYFWLEQNNLNSTVTFDSDLKIISDTSLEFLITTDNIVHSGDCTNLETPIIECIYTATLDTNINEVDGINSILYYTDSSFPNSISTKSLQFSNLEELTEEINSKAGGNFYITEEEGIYTFTHESPTFEPYKIVFASGYELVFSCGNLNYFTDTYRPEVISFTNNGIKLSQSYLNGFKTGVYSIQLTVETEDSIISESFCLFKDDELKCKIADIKDLKDLSYAAQLYNTLTLSQDCIDCECEQSCIIYQELLEFLNSLGYETRGCGC